MAICSVRKRAKRLKSKLEIKIVPEGWTLFNGGGREGKKKRRRKEYGIWRRIWLEIIKKKKKYTSEYKILNFPAEIRRDINCGFLLQGINETLLFTGKVKCTRLLKSAHGVSTGWMRTLQSCFSCFSPREVLTPVDGGRRLNIRASTMLFHTPRRHFCYV